MSGITTIRVTKSVHSKLKEYAEARELTIGQAVGQLLRERELARELERIEDLLKEQNMLLKQILRALKEGVPRSTTKIPEEPSIPAEVSDEALPSFVQGNPWLNVISKRGK